MTVPNNDVKHESFCIAEEIVDAVGLTDPHRSELLEKIKNRLEAFAAAILKQADDQGR